MIVTNNLGPRRTLPPTPPSVRTPERMKSVRVEFLRDLRRVSGENLRNVDRCGFGGRTPRTAPPLGDLAPRGPRPARRRRRCVDIRRADRPLVPRRAVRFAPESAADGHFDRVHRKHSASQAIGYAVVAMTLAWFLCATALHGPARPLEIAHWVPLFLLVALFGLGAGTRRGFAAGAGDPPRPLRSRCIDTVLHWQLTGAVLPLSLLLLVFMSRRFDVRAAVVLAVGGLIVTWLVDGGLLGLSRRLGWCRPAAGPLLSMVRGIAVERGVPEPRTWVHESAMANAFVMRSGDLVVTAPLLRGLTAMEVRGVLVHEFAHLRRAPRHLAGPLRRCADSLLVRVVVPDRRHLRRGRRNGSLLRHPDRAARRSCAIPSPRRPRGSSRA